MEVVRQAVKDMEAKQALLARRVLKLAGVIFATLILAVTALWITVNSNADIAEENREAICGIRKFVAAIITEDNPNRANVLAAFDREVPERGCDE